MNLDSKIWKASDYDARFASEVYAKFGSLDDEKEVEREKCDLMESYSSSCHPAPPSSVPSRNHMRSNRKEDGKAKEKDFGDDDYDFVDFQKDDEETVLPEVARATSLTSYFGSVATALYNNAEASLASSLTGSSSTISSSSNRRRERDRRIRRDGQGSRREDGRRSAMRETPPSSSLSSSSPSPLHPAPRQPPSREKRQGQPDSPAPAPPFSGHSSVALSHLYNFPIPKLRILIMAVGTRGDVQPLALLGMQLLADGHRVRLATHSCYRDYVLSYGGGGLEFYPLGGDPVKLSEFMVKTHGCILPSSPDILKLVPENLLMLNDIINSCWGACVDVDPGPSSDSRSGSDNSSSGSSSGYGAGRKFQADAIISNPVTYAHIHCAEALGVPLHLFFPQPWVPTKAFPHPLACMSYDKDNQWSTENYLSYQLVERMMWMSLEPFINTFRTTKLNLPPIRRGEHGMYSDDLC
jgi:hypothetical protein